MILTGHEIHREWSRGRLVIDPFVPEQINPNSYNFRLGPTLRCYCADVLDPRVENEYEEIAIPEDGFELERGRLYLGHTIERLGSDWYAPTFSARSSVARLGLFINLSASLGDIGYKGQWTLQLYSMNRVRVYSGMNIGQMMWWLPQGPVELYEGKYQGSAGPRSSDIHLDFDQQLARQRFPVLGASVDEADTGAKFARLSELKALYRIPDGFSMPVAEFAQALTLAQSEAIYREFEEIRATVGAFLTDSADRLEAIASEIRMPEQTRGLLAVRMSDVFGELNDLEFAVRSSGLDEDSDRASLAGIHSTVLGVRGHSEVVSAIEECWRAYYQLPAVAARVRAGDLSPAPRLAVFLQKMVHPRLAGVAFTGLGGRTSESVLIECVEGLAEELVAGDAVPMRYHFASPQEAAGSEDLTLREVDEVARSLRSRLGHDIDMEWAADEEGLHLLQVRPLTSTLEVEHRSARPVLEAYRLYFDEIPADIGLGAVADVYGTYAAKRGPAHRLAKEHGVNVGVGWVIRFNGTGLSDAGTKSELQHALARGGSEECVLDLGDTLRQIIVPKTEVADWLARTISADRAPGLIHVAIVRDYLKGDAGLISRRLGEGMLVEYTPEGLLALNRGTAGSKQIVIESIEDTSKVSGDPCSESLLGSLADLAKITKAMDDKYGPTALEWVQIGDQVYFTDYSLLDGRDAVHTLGAGLLISAGTAEGPLLTLEEHDLLEKLSVGPAVSIDRSHDVTGHEGLARIIDRVRCCETRPIVHARRPYAVLSVLIGEVQGFVFDEASVLCHLAILLREAKVPAVAASGIKGSHVIISDGNVTVVE